MVGASQAAAIGAADLAVALVAAAAGAVVPVAAVDLVADLEEAAASVGAARVVAGSLC